MARKGIFTPDIPEKPAVPEAGAAVSGAAPAGLARKTPNLLPRGAVGALQSSLARMQSNAVQEIDPMLVDDAGMEDRLGFDHASHKQLVTSLATYGQQVPVLLRPHPQAPGRYQIVYGRRRLKALKELGVPVKAMVRQLDDQALVMAQGQENTARQDLSFVEKASFAAQLLALGYERQTICDALSIDLPMVSRMLKVGQAFPLPFLRQVGPAPSIGRDRWLALVAAMEKPGVANRVDALMRGPDFVRRDSDGRFEAIFARATQSVAALSSEKTEAPAPRQLSTPEGQPLAELRQGPRGLTIAVSARDSGGFDRWLAEHAEELLRAAHARFTERTPDDA